MSDLNNLDLERRSDTLEEIVSILEPHSLRVVKITNVAQELIRVLEEYKKDIERLSEDVKYLERQIEELESRLNG